MPRCEDESPNSHCGEGATAKPQTPKELEDNVGELVKTMGLNQKCERMAKARARNSSTSGGFQGSMDVLGGLAGSANVSGNMQSSSSEMDQEFREKGCGSFAATFNTVSEAQRRIQCTLSDTKSCSSVKLRAQASVSIEVAPPEGTFEKLNDTMMRLAELQFKLASIGKDELAKSYEKQVLRQADLIDNFGRIDVNESTVRAKAGAQVKQLSQNVSSLSSQIETDVQSIVQAAAENELEQQGGTNALQGDIKSLINSRIQRQSDDISSDVQKALSSTRVDVDSSANIRILAPNTITLSNTVIDADVAAKVATSAVTTTSVELGKKIAQELMTEAATGTSSKMDNKGMEAIQALQNAGNALAQRIQQETLENLKPESKLAMVIMGVVAVAVVGAVASATMGENEEDSEPFFLKDGEVNKTRWAKLAFNVLTKLALMYYVYDFARQAWDKLSNPWEILQLRKPLGRIGLVLLVIMLACKPVNDSLHPLVCLTAF